MQKDSEEWGRKLEISTVGELNDQIVSQRIQKILLMQEAIQESELPELQSRSWRLKQEVRHDRGSVLLRKTTFSTGCPHSAGGARMKPHPIAVDNYFVNREHTPLDEFGEKDYECLEAIDVEQFNKDMLALLNGERIELPVFNFKTGQREYKGDFLQLGKEDILVIEGIHGLNDKLSYALPKESKFKIYISALTQLNIDEHNRIPTTDGRLIRRIVRDARTRGTSATDTIARWPSVRSGRRKIFFHTRKKRMLCLTRH